MMYLQINLIICIIIGFVNSQLINFNNFMKINEINWNNLNKKLNYKKEINDGFNDDLCEIQMNWLFNGITNKDPAALACKPITFKC